MKKKYVLKNKIKFNKVIQNGENVKNENYVIYFLPDFDFKVGIAIGKKIGKAYIRNYHRRVLRMLIRTNIDVFPKKYNIVIVGRKNLENISYSQKEKSLLNLLGKVPNNE